MCTCDLQGSPDHDPRPPQPQAQAAGPRRSPRNRQPSAPANPPSEAAPSRPRSGSQHHETKRQPGSRAGNPPLKKRRNQPSSDTPAAQLGQDGPCNPRPSKETHTSSRPSPTPHLLDTPQVPFWLQQITAYIIVMGSQLAVPECIDQLSISRQLVCLTSPRFFGQHECCNEPKEVTTMPASLSLISLSTHFLAD